MHFLPRFFRTSPSKILLCVVFLGVPSLIQAGGHRKNQVQPPHRFIVTRLWGDIRYMAGETDFYAVVGGLSLAPRLFGSAFTNESPELTERWGGSRFADNFLEAGEIIGDGIFSVSVSISTWTVGKIAGSESLQSFGSDALRAQAINGLLTVAMKGVVNRTRPNGSPYSYPSGHTSSAFALAGVVHKHYGIKWGLPSFVVASYVGLSRLQENKHYLSDVIAGGVLGSYVGLKVAGRSRRKSEQLSVEPTIGKYKGITISLKF